MSGGTGQASMVLQLELDFVALAGNCRVSRSFSDGNWPVIHAVGF
jgi:hypothetical protein